MRISLSVLILAAVLGLSAVTIRADAELSRAETKLSAAVIDAVNYEATPLREVLRDISRKAGVSIVTDSKHIDVNAPVTLEVTNLSALNVLELVLANTGYVRQIRGSAIWVTTRERAEANPRVMVRTYDVRDITMVIRDFPAPEMGLGERGAIQRPAPERDDPPTIDDLIDLIQTTVTPENWNRKGFSISKFKGNLIISATAETHRGIRVLLAQL